MQRPAPGKEEHLAVIMGWGLTGWKAAPLEKAGVLVDSTLTMGQQQHAPAEKKGSNILGCINRSIGGER